MNPSSKGISPAPRVADVTEYTVPRHGAPIDLYLDGNEGAVPPASVLNAVFEKMPEVCRCYPKREALEKQIAEELTADRFCVIVTAGGDDGLDRMCRSVLCEGRELILPEPTFEMIGRYAKLAGATIVSVPRPDNDYPTQAVLDAITDKTAMIAIVTPNNPTGSVISPFDLERIAAAAPNALILVDLAYTEFADDDLTQVALNQPNAIIVRTFSKAWGLAGLRVGYAIGPENVIKWMRAAAGPYAVANPSLAMAAERFANGQDDMNAFVAKIREERAELTALLTDLGADVIPSQANFLFARFEDAEWVRDGLAGFGISVRHFGNHPDLANGLRITCPGNDDDFLRLKRALKCVLSPEGVIANVPGMTADIPTQCPITTTDEPLSPGKLEQLRQQLKMSSVALVTTNIESIKSARRVGVLPIGVFPKDSDDNVKSQMIAAGASRVFNRLEELEGLL